MICRWCDLAPSLGSHRTSSMGTRLAHAGRLFVQTANLMVGLPDYETYVRHREQNHPGEPVMTREEFFRERQNSRYGAGKAGSFRCC